MDRSITASLSRQAQHEQYRRLIDQMSPAQLKEQLALAAQAVMVTQPAALQFMAHEAAGWMAENSRLRLELRQLQTAELWDEEELVG